MRVLLLLGVVLLAGCHGALVDALEERQASSCIFWRTPFASGVTSTAGTPLSVCLADPCRGH